MRIIDRRLNPSNKSITDRQRFIGRTKDQIKKSVSDAVSSKKISDTGKGFTIPIKGISEPTFQKDRNTGKKDFVIPGNEEYEERDAIGKPKGSGKGSGKNASDGGDGQDEFQFTLTESEFMDFFMDDLELPDLVRKKMKDATVTLPERRGFTTSGNPANLDVKATLKQSLGRTIALKRPKKDFIAFLEEELEQAIEDDDQEKIQQLEEELKTNKRRIKAIPWIDPVDVRYRLFVQQPQPVAKAVMFCLMDVSSSMTEQLKDMSKRFFRLLYVFLKKKYKAVDIVFIRHTSEAEEVTEDVFFYDQQSGGTIVSTVLEKLIEVQKQRFPTDDYNIYVCQCSDGDSWSNDGEKCIKLVNDDILQFVQYFAYLEVKDGENTWASAGKTSLWESYSKIANPKFAMRNVKHKSEIWTVFKDLFSREKT